MNKMDFDSALRRQVMSLPELMRQQYADLEPKTRTVLSTPEIFNIQRIVLTGCGDSYAALLAVKPAFEKYAKIRTEVVPTIDLARDYEKKNLGYAPQSPLVIAVSNSGQVARVGEAVRRCRKAGAFTLGITGHEESVLGQSAERILKLDIPKFESAPGTRSYMVCVMALYLLAIRIGEVRGRYTMDVASARRKEIKALADALEKTVTGYASCNETGRSIQLKRGKVHYALLPVWILNTRWEDKDFLFAMNGQTGKLVGNLPVSTKRVIGLFAAIAALLVAISVTAILLMAR